MISRLTISLGEELYRVLKEAAARQDRSIRSIIEESLWLRGTKPIQSARALVEQTRRQAKLSEADVLLVANDEVRAEREA